MRPLRRPLVLCVALGILAAALPVMVTPPAAHAAYPGSEGLIAWEEPRSPGACTSTTDIKAARPDGTGLRTLRTFAERPQFSPDGRQLSYSDGSSVYAMNLNGSNWRRIGAGWNSTWSPDGTKIATDSGGKIWIYPSAGGTGTQLTFPTSWSMSGIDSESYTYGAGGRADGTPAWSPDGTKIAFFRDYSVNWRAPNDFPVDRYTHIDIFTVNVDGTDTTRLTGGTWKRVPGQDRNPGNLYADDDGISDTPDWSPDGSTIAYSSRRGYPEGNQVFTVPANGGTMTNFSNQPYPTNALFVWPAYSPTGRLGYFFWDWDRSTLDSNRYTFTVGGAQPFHVINGMCAVDWGSAEGGPVARMNEPSHVTGGTYQFVSTSTDSIGSISEYWNFGDPDSGVLNTSFGRTASHTYAKPGTYTVSLRVVNSVLQEATTTKTFTIDAPTLDLAIGLPPDGNASFEADQEFVVRINASASDGLGSLSDVTFDPPLRWEPEGVLEMVSGPEPAIPAELTLEPGGDTFSTDYRLRVVGAGEFTLFTKATAKDTAGRVVAPDEVSRNGSVSGLKVTITYDANPIDLERETEVEDADNDGLDDEPGFEPKDVKGTITIENTSEDTLQNLSLSGTQSNLDLRMLTRVNGVLTPVPSPTPFPMELTSAPAPKEPYGALGTLAPGEKTELEFGARVDGPGLFGVATTVLGEAAAGGQVRGHGEGVLTVRSDIKLRVQMKVGTVYGRPPRIDEGQYYLVFGTLKNVTTDETLELKALLPNTEGNGIALGPVKSPDVPAEDVCSNELFAPTLEPGESIEFTIRVVTKDVLAPLATARQVSAVKVDFDGTATASDGTQTELGDTNIAIELGNGKQVTDSGERLRVEINPNLPTPKLLSWSDLNTYASFVDAWTEALVLGIADWGVQTIHLLAVLVEAGGAAVTSLFNGEAGAFLDKQLTDFATFLWQLYGSMSPLERAEIKQMAYNDVMESMGAAIVDTEEALRIVGAAIDDYFNGFERWVTRGDTAADEQDMQELVRITAEPLRVAATTLVDEIAGEAVVKGLCRIFRKDAKFVGPAQRRAEKLEAEAPAKVDAALTADRATGDPRATSMAELKRQDPWTPINPAQAKGGWVVDEVSDANLRAYTRDTPVMVAVRSRAKETTAWLESAQGATLKPEAYKPKMANGTDGAYLGYRTGPPGYGGGDLGSAVLAEPLPWEVVAQRIDHLDGAEWRLARKRWETRYKEWYGHLPGETPVPGKLSKVDELKAAAPNPIVDPAGVQGQEGVLYLPKKGTVNYSGNLDTAGKAVEMEPRRFQMRKVTNPPDNGLFDAGREYFEIWLEDADGVLKRVTGDIDTVGVWGKDGRWLDNATAIKVVEDLTDVSGAQHPWTSTWADPEGRAELLAAHLWSDNPATRGEPMLLYVNGEARMAWFDPRKNYDVDDGPAFIFLEGAPHTFDPIDMPATINGPAGLPDPNDLVQRGYAAPKASLKMSPDMGGPELPRCDVDTSNARTARILRLDGDGHIEEWIQDVGWRDVDPATLCTGARPVFVRPQTGVLADTPAGATELPIIQLVGEPANSGFEIGQTIVIDPGGPNEEFAVVVGFGSLVLLAPLTKPHEAGEVVSALYSEPEMPNTGFGSGVLLLTVGSLLVLLGLAALAASRNRKLVSS